MVNSIIENPKCPHCNTELECDDTYDFYYDSEQIALSRVGHCPNCEKDYQWVANASCVQWENINLRET